MHLFFLMSAEAFLFFSSFLSFVHLEDLKEMCELLGIEQSVLERAFSYRTVEAKMEKVATTLNVSQVRDELLSCTTFNCSFLSRLF